MPPVFGAVRSGIEDTSSQARPVSSPKRLDALADLPTVAESSYLGFEADP